MILILTALLPSFEGTYSHPVHTFPAETERGNTAFLFELTLNKCPFCSLFSAMSFTFLCFCLVIVLFEMAPKQSAVWCSERKKVVMCFLKKMHVFNKLCSGISYSAVSVGLKLRNQSHGTSRKRKKKFSDLCIGPLQEVLT